MQLMKVALSILFVVTAVQAQTSVQTVGKDCGTTASCSIALPNPVATGDVTILALRIGNGQIAAVTGMTQVGVVCKDAVDGQALSVWMGTGQTVTISVPSATFIRGMLAEYSSAGPPATSGCQTGTASPASAPATTGFAIVAVSTGAAVTFSSPMKLEGSAGGKVALLDGTQAAITLSPSTSWAALSFALSAAGPPPPPPPPPLVVAETHTTPAFPVGPVIMPRGNPGVTFTVTNSGTADLVLSDIAASNKAFGLESPPFLPVTLKPGQTTTFTGYFNPTVVGTFSDVLEIKVNTTAGKISVPVTATAQ